MANIETLKLLCAGSTRYHPALISTQSSDVLNRIEIAGLLSGLNAIQTALTYAKHVGDLSAERKLWAMVYEWVVGKALRDGWQVVRGRPTLANMSYLAVFEVVRPNRCPKCNGCGIVKAKACQGCNGSGYKPLSNRTIAKAIGVDESNYRRVWCGRYQSVYEYVRDIDCDVNRAVKMSDAGHDKHAA